MGLESEPKDGETGNNSPRDSVFGTPRDRSPANRDRNQYTGQRCTGRVTEGDLDA